MISFYLLLFVSLVLGIGLGLWAAQRRGAKVRARADMPPPPDGGRPDFSWVDALPDAAMVLGARNQLLKTNAACTETLGELPEGVNVELYLRQPQVLEALTDVARLGAATERELILLSPQERVFQIRVATFGAFKLVTLHDSTRQRLMDRMRVDFVANASHELRTPLATLIGFIETLQTGAADNVTTRERFLKIMSSESQRMVRLIDDLLSLSRIELDKYIRPVMPLKLRPVLENMHNSLLMRLEDDSRQLVIEADDSLPDVVADRDQILQVLHNLINNAIKYGRHGSPIHLEALKKDDIMVEVRVRDEGEGIPSEHLPRLTERFYRVDTARSREMGGTGLGLAIVKHIVERHRGQLMIASDPGKGTTVSFTLPIASAESVAAADTTILSSN